MTNKEPIKLETDKPVEEQINTIDLKTGKVKTNAGVTKQISDHVKSVKAKEAQTTVTRKESFNNELELQNDLLVIIKDNLTKGTDYAEIPGTKNESLLQAGANKIALWAKLRIDLELVEKIIEIEHKAVYYKYKAIAYHKETGQKAGEAFASCNSQESKFKLQSDKNIFNTMNTIDQMAQKRANVRVVRTTLGLTGLFTQDMEENKVAPKEIRAEVYQLAEVLAMEDKYIKQYAKKNNDKKGTKDLRKKTIINQARSKNKITNHYRAWTEEETKEIIKTITTWIKGENNEKII